MLGFYFEMHRHSTPPPALLGAGGCYGVAIHSEKTAPLYRICEAESFNGHSRKSRAPPSLLFALWLRCVGHHRPPAPFLLWGPFGLSFWQRNRAVSFARDGAPRQTLIKHRQVPHPQQTPSGAHLPRRGRRTERRRQRGPSVPSGLRALAEDAGDTEPAASPLEGHPRPQPPPQRPGRVPALSGGGLFSVPPAGADPLSADFSNSQEPKRR